MKYAAVGAILIVAYIYFFAGFKWNENINIKGKPVLTEVEETILQRENCIIRKHHEIEFAARILSKEDYKYEIDGKVVPMDIVFGWGKMSQDKYIKQIDLSQGVRWFHYKLNGVPHNQIKCNFDNFHIIPQTGKIKREIDSFREGEAVMVKGYLVDLSCSNGVKRNSSLSWCDRSATSCEQILITSIKELENEKFDNRTLKKEED